MNLFKKAARSIAPNGTTSSKPSSSLPLSIGHDSPHKVIHPLVQPHRIFLIPEILENILSFLSPCALKYRAKPVCRLWRQISARYPPRVTALWNSPFSTEKEEAVFDDKLAICQCLHLRPRWHYAWFQSLEARDMIWKRLEDAVVMHSQTNRSFGITMLIIEGDLPLTTRVEPLLAKAPLLATMLTTITIKEYRIGPILFIDNILNTCTNLLDLHLESIRWSYSSRDRFEPVLLGLRDDSDFWTNISKKPLKLQKLTLKYWRISCIVMQVLFTRCPSLRSLAIASAYGDGILRPGGEVFHEGRGILLDAPFQLSPLYRLIASCFPSLEDIHVSFTYNPMRPNDAVVFRQAFCRVKSWRLSIRDINSVGLKSLIMPTLSGHSLPQIAFPILTSLHIQDRWPVYELNNSLHAYLVSPVAASLVNLKAGSLYYQYSSLIETQELWTCRRLETLHLLVCWSTNQDASCSREVLSYLTQLLPRMRELVLQCDRFHFGLEGGFCLLKRMRNLEKIHILTNSRHQFSEKDLHWLARYPPTRIQKFKRRLWMAEFRRRSEYRQESAPNDVQAQIGSADGAVLRKSSLRDLVECLEGDYDVGGGSGPDDQWPVDCLPCLESLTIQALSSRRHIRKKAASTIQSMKLLRPDCEFHMINYI